MWNQGRERRNSSEKVCVKQHLHVLMTSYNCHLIHVMTLTQDEQQHAHLTVLALSPRYTGTQSASPQSE